MHELKYMHETLVSTTQETQTFIKGANNLQGNFCCVMSGSREGRKYTLCKKSRTFNMKTRGTYNQHGT